MVHHVHLHIVLFPAVRRVAQHRLNQRLLHIDHAFFRRAENGGHRVLDQVVPNARRLVHQRNTKRLHLVLGANARPQQDRRRLHRPRREDDLVALDALSLAPRLDLQPNRPAILNQHPAHQTVRADREIQTPSNPA